MWLCLAREVIAIGRADSCSDLGAPRGRRDVLGSAEYQSLNGHRRLAPAACDEAAAIAVE